MKKRTNLGSTTRRSHVEVLKVRNHWPVGIDETIQFTLRKTKGSRVEPSHRNHNEAPTLRSRRDNDEDK